MESSAPSRALECPSDVTTTTLVSTLPPVPLRILLRSRPRTPSPKSGSAARLQPQSIPSVLRKSTVSAFASSLRPLEAPRKRFPLSPLHTPHRPQSHRDILFQEKRLHRASPKVYPPAFSSFASLQDWWQRRSRSFRLKLVATQAYPFPLRR